MNVLVIKTGALGDVVRTQYFAKYLVERYDYNITWLTSPEALQILSGNRYIANIIIDISSLKGTEWDIIYNFEDDVKFCELAKNLKTNYWVGLQISNDSSIRYDDVTAIWNDMGLHSRYGLETANRLKRQNKNSHLNIFEKIFQVDNVTPNWKGEIYKTRRMDKSNLIVGCNFFSGERWPNKSLNFIEAAKILQKLEVDDRVKTVIILGNLSDSQINQLGRFKKTMFSDTSNSIDKFFNIIHRCSLIITCDSLAVHVAMSARTPFICFFGPTSASEVRDPFLKHINITADYDSYCTYDPRIVAEGLSAEKIYSAINQLLIQNDD